MTSFRSTLDTVFQIVRVASFRQEHVDACMPLPFYNLIKGMYEYRNGRTSMEKSNAVGVVIQGTYSSEHGGFRIGGKTLRVTPTEISIILGVEGGNVPVPTYDRDNLHHSTWYTEQFPNGARELTVAMVKERLLELLDSRRSARNLESFCKIMSILILSTIFYPPSSARIPKWIVKVSEDLQQMKRYDWALNMCTIMMDPISRGKQKYLPGCCCILLPWFYEHVAVAQPILVNAYPRALKWNMTPKLDNFKEDFIDALEANQVNCRQLELTLSENLLLTRWRGDNNMELPSNEEEEGSDESASTDGGERSESHEEGSEFMVQMTQDSPSHNDNEIHENQQFTNGNASPNVVIELEQKVSDLSRSLVEMQVKAEALTTELDGVRQKTSEEINEKDDIIAQLVVEKKLLMDENDNLKKEKMNIDLKLGELERRLLGMSTSNVEASGLGEGHMRMLKSCGATLIKI